MTKPDDAEFFIGYAPPIPPRLARFVRRALVALAVGLSLCAAVIVAGHRPLEAGTFEFGHAKRFAGTIVEQPYAAVRLDGGDVDGAPIPLLVASGKHGAGPLLHGLNGRHVSFTGTRIERGGHLMIEIESLESAAPDDHAPGPSLEAIDAAHAEPARLTGEIVDSKCYLGVMVPGSGKTHKECASLCIRGGIPPAFLVQDAKGASALLLLTGSQGESITAEATRAAGEALTLTGTVRRENGWLMLRSDPASWRPLSK